MTESINIYKDIVGKLSSCAHKLTDLNNIRQICDSQHKTREHLIVNNNKLIIDEHKLFKQFWDDFSQLPDSDHFSESSLERSLGDLKNIVLSAKTQRDSDKALLKQRIGILYDLNVIKDGTLKLNDKVPYIDKSLTNNELSLKELGVMKADLNDEVLTLNNTIKNLCMNMLRSPSDGNWHILLFFFCNSQSRLSVFEQQLSNITKVMEIDDLYNAIKLHINELKNNITISSLDYIKKKYKALSSLKMVKDKLLILDGLFNSVAELLSLSNPSLSDIQNVFNEIQNADNDYLTQAKGIVEELVLFPVSEEWRNFDSVKGNYNDFINNNVKPEFTRINTLHDMDKIYVSVKKHVMDTEHMLILSIHSSFRRFIDNCVFIGSEATSDKKKLSDACRITSIGAIADDYDAFIGMQKQMHSKHDRATVKITGEFYKSTNELLIKRCVRLCLSSNMSNVLIMPDYLSAELDSRYIINIEFDLDVSLGIFSDSKLFVGNISTAGLLNGLKVFVSDWDYEATIRNVLHSGQYKNLVEDFFSVVS